MRKSVFLLFTDLKGYSKLNESEMIEFQQNICRDLAKELSEFIEPSNHVAFNTWGDAVYAVFDAADIAVRFALAYRDFFKDRKVGGKPLTPRIAGHFGEANPIDDPLNNGKKNVFGKHVNTAARMEPITRPGEIFVSEEFKRAVEQDSSDSKTEVTFEELGILSLAKNYGKEGTVYRLKRASERKQVLDKLIKEDLTPYIPSIEAISQHESRELNQLRLIETPSMLTKMIDDIDLDRATSIYLLRLAELTKSRGLYETSLKLLQTAETRPLIVDEEEIHAIPHLPTYKKTKANVLTRLGRYKEAQELIFALWHSGNKDSDTLSMLAAQYKRWAIFGKTRTEDITKVSTDEVDQDLLNRACKLYVEAFRNEISEYYPAINAAYLYLMRTNSKEKGKGRKLAQYILDAWPKETEDNWWLATTRAEAEMLIGDSEDALVDFQEAITKYTPKAFELRATLEQIQIYAKVTNSEEELEEIINYLENPIK